MAHFAELDDNNIVLRVLTVDNLHEKRGQEFLANDCGLGGRWIQTSYNGNMRFRFAGPGFTYDEKLNAFIPPKCHEEAELNADDASWRCSNLDHFEDITVPNTSPHQE